MEYDKRLIKCTKGGSANVNGGPEDKALTVTHCLFYLGWTHRLERFCLLLEA